MDDKTTAELRNFSILQIKYQLPQLKLFQKDGKSLWISL
jgi:hypothetical protein